MYYVGIDIAKSFHVVSVIDDNEIKVINKPFKINNDAKGFEKLLTILDSVTLDKDDFLIGLEATGIYGENLLEFLKSKGYSVKLLNPALTAGRKCPWGTNFKVSRTNNYEKSKE